MARAVVSTCGRLIGNYTTKNTSCNSRCLQGLSTPQLMTSRENTVIKRFQGQSLRVGIASSFEAQRNFSIYSHAQPGTPPTPPPSGNSSLGKWILGMIITVIVPFLTNKWTKLRQIKDEVETVVEETEQVIEHVEDVAAKVDEAAKVAAAHLPEGGKLRNAVDFVENVAEEIVQDAHLVENIIHKVEKVEDMVDSTIKKVDNNNTN